MATAPKKTPAVAKSATTAAPKTTVKKVAAPKASTEKAVAKSPAPKVATKKVASAVAAKPAKAPAKKTGISVSPEQRYHMIATASYFLAERRGFATGHEMDDWATAEAQVEAMLNSKS